MRKVAIFTTFGETESGYSLVSVTETILKGLIEHHYDPIVLVDERFKSTKPLWQPEKIDIRPVVPAMVLTEGVAEDFEQRVQLILKMLQENLKDAQVCITQDIMLQSWYKEHNIAVRRYAEERPDLLWLHWLHSCPDVVDKVSYPDDCRHTPPPGYLIYPNSVDKGRVCSAYRLSGQERKVVTCRYGHALDPLEMWNYSPLAKDLARRADLMNGDITAVYPVRLDRGKQPEKIIRLMAGVKKLRMNPRLLIIDWQSMGERFQKYIDELTELAISLGIGKEVNFTSRLHGECSNGVPRLVVQELMDMTSVYIHPSQIETYSFTVHEAMLRGKLVVGNFDLPVTRELFGDAAIYMDFGSDRVKREYTPSEQDFWDDEAKRLVAEAMQNRALMAQIQARTEWTPDRQWNKFERLFYLEAK